MNSNDKDPGQGSTSDDQSPTVVNEEVTEASDDPAGQDDYTTYSPGDDSQSRGFATARKIAEDARTTSGRLLKKRFVLEDVMGEGGMGRVYRARDLRKVEAEDKNPYVAVKVLGQSFKEHPKAFVALQQEAVKSQKLAHPNIVTVHDFDRDGDTIFMTMELLKGDPLDQLIRLQAPFSKELALRYFNDLCAGLDYAHKRGLIHSDFKPGNIFVTAAGTVKILDFGIARAASSGVLSHDYDAGDLGALTPAYATVEMIQGQPPSFSDDVYALACVLYLMLTGEHPYQRKSAAEARELKLKPARIESLDKREWQALSAALSFDPGQRPASIEAFRRQMSPPERAGILKPGLAAGAVLALVVGGFFYQQLRADRQQQETIATSLAAAKDCFFAEDFRCAVENALVVRKLAPGNREAEQLLARAEQELADLEQARETEDYLEQARQCLERGDFDCSMLRLEAVLQAQPNEGRALQLKQQLEAARNTAQLELLIERAENCLQAGDLDCASVALAEAEQAGALAQQLAPLRATLVAEQDAQMAAAQQRDGAIADLLQAARGCIDRGDFACGDSRLAELNTLDPGNVAGIELQQALAAAREQQRSNQRLVAGILNEARACEERKDYSCAIAKSETALAIVPGHAEASATAARARQAQQQAKRAIAIE